MNNSFWRSHFTLNKRQANGIFYLIISIILLQTSVFLLSRYEGTRENISDIDKSLSYFEHEFDSLVELKNNRAENLQPFNPNYISDFKGYQLGMSVDQIDRLHNYRSKGRFVNSTEEFQQITGIDDSLLHSISHYFKFPDWVGKEITPKISNDNPIAPGKMDINDADGEALRSISGIGVQLSERILKYRRLLGGYSYNDQLFEVWGLKPEVAKRVLQKFEVKELPDIQKTNVNDASLTELATVVYIDYSLARKILDYKEQVAEIQLLEELKKIDGFPIHKFDRIALYLVAE